MKGDWISKVTDTVEARVRKDIESGVRKADEPIVCASGISPSGPIHLGNLRELMTTHFIAEELKRRGHHAEHIHSWDDYDRFRKVPAGIPAEWEQHIGKPLCEVPDPSEQFASYGDRYIAGFSACFEPLGIDVRAIKQSTKYPAGAYRAQMRTALERRNEIFDILSRFQTKKLQTVPLEERRANYWPISVYSPATGTDVTTVLDFNRDDGTVTYSCPEMGEQTFNLDADETLHSKLLWKVDWPMRWAYERVVFEPGGLDHASPGSSYTVGTSISPQLFDWKAPEFVQYGFVGMGGRTKMSSSAGGAATPELALRFIEPAILRWFYLRRAPKKAFTMDFGADIWRSYDEFDRLVARSTTEKAQPADAMLVARASGTSLGEIETPVRPVSFRVLSTAADMTNGNLEQVLRIANDHLDVPVAPAQLAEELQPRLSAALGWASHCLPEDERLQIRNEPAHDVWEGLSDEVKQAVTLLHDGLGDHWTLPDLTTLMYGVAKTVRGLPMDAQPDQELKSFQRAVFVAVYHLLLGADTGPRLPTLILSLGQDRVRPLLQP